MTHQVKDPVLSLQQLGWLLWHKFNPWPGNFCMLWVLQKRKRKKERKRERKRDRQPHFEVDNPLTHRFFFFSVVSTTILHYPWLVAERKG